ncbi:MAG TPA: hypothetical protein DCG12_12900 [Planctomycetaceae bacterium]|nr:hypothetical protein [Planctomycetaceae bacterium]
MSLVKNLALQVLTLLKHLWALVCDLSGFSRGLLAIIRFEIKRVTTPGRAFWWVFVAIFPIVIACLLRYVVEPQVRENIQNAVIHQQMMIEQNQNQQIIVPATSGDQSGMGQLPPGAQLQPGQAQPMAAPPPIGSNRDQLYTVALYLLGPSIACMLGALLIAAPAIASELEQHSWIYLATRPNGVFFLVAGKYIVAVMWAFSATLIGVTGGAMICGQEYNSALSIPGPQKLQLSLSQLNSSVGVDDEFALTMSVTNQSQSAINDVQLRVRHTYEFKLTDLAEKKRDNRGSRLVESIATLGPGETKSVDIRILAEKATGNQVGRITAMMDYPETPSPVSVVESIQIFKESPPTFFWRVVILIATAFFAAIAYSALYLVIGALFPARAMVFCVAYTIGAEGILSMLPAVVNRLTVQYRLRSFLFHHLQDGSGVSEGVGDALLVTGGADQPLWILIHAAICLGVSLLIVLSREFTTAAESDV